MGKKTDDTVKRLNRIQELAYGEADSLIEQGVDAVVVSAVIDGLSAGLECATLLLGGEYDDISDEDVAKGIVGGTMAATLIKLIALIGVSKGRDAGEVIDELAGLIGPLFERGE